MGVNGPRKMGCPGIAAELLLLYLGYIKFTPPNPKPKLDPTLGAALINIRPPALTQFSIVVKLAVRKLFNSIAPEFPPSINTNRVPAVKIVAGFAARKSVSVQFPLPNTAFIASGLALPPQFSPALRLI